MRHPGLVLTNDIRTVATQLSPGTVTDDFITRTRRKGEAEVFWSTSRLSFDDARIAGTIRPHFQRRQDDFWTAQA